MLDYRDIDVAITTLANRGVRPVRVWLTVNALGLLFRDVSSAIATRPRVLRFRGLPITITPPPTRSRVVGTSGVVEYV